MFRQPAYLARYILTAKDKNRIKYFDFNTVSQFGT
jgi:hypothetical protein